MPGSRNQPPTPGRGPANITVTPRRPDQAFFVLQRVKIGLLPWGSTSSCLCLNEAGLCRGCCPGCRTASGPLSSQTVPPTARRDRPASGHGWCTSRSAGSAPRATPGRRRRQVRGLRWTSTPRSTPVSSAVAALVSIARPTSALGRRTTRQGRLGALARIGNPALAATSAAASASGAGPRAGARRSPRGAARPGADRPTVRLSAGDGGACCRGGGRITEGRAVLAAGGQVEGHRQCVGYVRTVVDMRGVGLDRPVPAQAPAALTAQVTS